MTPESPYMTTDETRAREDLLEPDANIVTEIISGSPTYHTHTGLVNQVVEKASGLIHEMTDLFTGGGVARSESSELRLKVQQEYAESRARGKLQQEYAESRARESRGSLRPESPYQLSEETRSRDDNVDGEKPERRASFTAESPYKVSDETRARDDILADAEMQDLKPESPYQMDDERKFWSESTGTQNADANPTKFNGNLSEI